MLVSVAIFSMVMVIALGALLALSEANRRAALLAEATNNFNAAIDSMARSIRTGSSYQCGTSSSLDCTGTALNQFSYLPNGASQRTVYKYSSDATACGDTDGEVGCILRSQDGGTTFASITSPEIYVSALKFYVIGAPVGVQSPWGLDIQPMVTMLIAGHVTVKGGQTSTFSIQTSVTQRIYDI